MDTAEIVYYTCLNNECANYRTAFMEGDTLHEGCARERLWPEGEQRAQMPRWLSFVAPIAMAALTAGAIALLRRSMNEKRTRPPSTRDETRMQSWNREQAER